MADDYLSQFDTAARATPSQEAPAAEPDENFLQGFNSPGNVDAGVFERSRRLAEARSRDDQEGDTYLQRFGRQLAQRLGPVGVGYNLADNARYRAAQERLQSGKPEEEDYSTIAAFERQHRQDRQRDESWGGYLGERALRLPGEVAGFQLGGQLLGAAGIGAPALGSAASYAGGRAIAGTAGRLAALTAAIPSMYAEEAQRRNTEAGRDALDPRGLAPAFGLGMIQTAILGSLNEFATGVGGTGLIGAAQRGAIRTGTGLLEQQAADIVGSAVGLQTGYGTIGSFLRGDDDRFKSLAGSTLTFAAFAAMHGANEQSHIVMDRFGKALQESARRGDSLPFAFQRLNPVIEQLHEALKANPDLTRAQAKELMEKLPEGAVRDYGLALADAFQQRIVHQEAQGPEPGLEPPGAPETAPEPPGGKLPEQTSPAAQGRLGRITGQGGRKVAEGAIRDVFPDARLSEKPTFPGELMAESNGRRVALSFDRDTNSVHVAFDMPGKISGISQEGLQKGTLPLFRTFRALTEKLGYAGMGFSYSAEAVRAADYAKLLTRLGWTQEPQTRPDPGGDPRKQLYVWRAGEPRGTPGRPGEGAGSDASGGGEAAARVLQPGTPGNAGEGVRPSSNDEGGPKPSLLERMRAKQAGLAPVMPPETAAPVAGEPRPGVREVIKNRAQTAKDLRETANLLWRVAATQAEMNRTRNVPEVAPGAEAPRQVALPSGANTRIRTRRVTNELAKILENPTVEGVHNLTRLLGGLEMVARGEKIDAHAYLAREAPELVERLGPENVKELLNLSKELELDYANDAKRLAISEASFRRVLERQLSQDLKDAQVPSEGEGKPEVHGAQGAGPAEIRGASAQAGGEPGPPTPADSSQARSDQLAAARAAKPKTLLSLLKGWGGLSRQSAKDHGFDIKEMEENVPSIFKGTYQDRNAKGKMVTKTRAGTLDFIKAAEMLINEGHMVGEKGSPYLADLLREKILDHTTTLEQNVDQALAREYEAFLKEQRDALSTQTGPDVAEAIREGQEAGEAEGRQDAAGEVQHGNAEAPDDFYDENGEPRFFVTPRGAEHPELKRFFGPGGAGSGGGGGAPSGTGGGSGGGGGSIADPQYGTLGAGIIRENLSRMAAKQQAAQYHLREAVDFFDHWLAPPETKVDRFLQFTDAFEGGQIDSLPPEIQGFAHTIRRLNLEREDAIRARGLVNTFIDNYLGHLWKKPGSDLTSEEIGRILSARRPLAGTESYRHKRYIPTYRDGIEAGLEPADWNPARLALLKMKEVDKSVMGHDVVKEMKQSGMWQFVRLGGDRPEGYVEAPNSKVFAPPEVKLTEYFDKQQMEGLEDFARSLGINLKRTMGGTPGSSVGQDVQTRFGTPEEILAHEIGHQLDDRYHLRDWTHMNPAMQAELTRLADTRASGRVEQSYRDYLHQPTEQIANLVAAYLHAPELARQLAPTAIAKLDAFLQSKPELAPLRDIKPSMELGERDQMKRLAGPMLTGSYYTPEPVAELLNNYLMPGLRGRKLMGVRVYDIVRDFGNLQNMANLGLSAFHFTGTALNSVFSGLALGLKQVARGDVRQGLETAATAPLAPYRNYMLGSKMLREINSPGSQGAEIAALVDQKMAAGGRASMDAFYHSDHLGAFRRAWQEGRTLGILGHAVPGFVELLSKPIMSLWVPRVKLGAFAMIAKDAMAQNPNMERSAMRDVLGKAWDSIDNRFGQVVYDNLFWHRINKDLAMVAVRSVGWNYGTWAELGGGIKDVLKGKGLTDRAAFTLALPMGAGLMGGLLHLLLNGKPPDELKDYFFPRTGTIRKDGSADRVALPTYMRDVFSLFNRADEGPFTVASNAWTMLEHKVHPTLSTLFEMLHNQDFYGTAIRNPNEPVVRQARDEAAHLVKSFNSFSVQGLMQQLGQGASPGQAASAFVGLTPAPAYITRSAEQQRAMETGRRNVLTPQEKLRRQRMGLR